MSKVTRSDYLALHGKTLIEQGYNIVPIPPQSKAPGYDGWQKTKSTVNMLKEWMADGQGEYGIGILTRHTPAIDLDITDPEMLKRCTSWLEDRFGFLVIRVGREPRFICQFRCDEPFRKLKSGKYVDEWNDKHEVEILADGQQFVAYGLHKDTGRPYKWTTLNEPINTPREDLPLITQQDAKDFLAFFNATAKELGWKKLTNGLSGGARAVDDDDPFADVESVVELPADEIRNRLMMVPNAEDYDRWVQIGMALFHQFGGDDEGLRMWHEWSEVADNYEPDALDTHWRSFDIEGKKRAPITARYIIKLAKEAATTLAVERVTELRDAFFAAKDEMEWRQVCAKVRHAEIDAVARAQITEIARQQFQRVTGSKLPIVEVRKALAYELPTKERMPEWCKHWVYDASDDRFFHVKMKISMSVQGFNAVFSRQALTKKDLLEGKTAPSSTPADLALNVYKIYEVHGREYTPGEEEVYIDAGIRKANTYPTYQIPKVPDELSPKEKKAIQVVKGHIAHLLESQEEQRLMLNWLAWIVQNPGKLLKWAMLLQGVEGDGKSFFGSLLRAVMGVGNVRMLNANVLESNFNGWSVGQCVLVIEEPRLQGQNKYDVINKIKPLITNAVIPVHAKGKEAHDAINTSNYFLPTNFRDALPLNDNDRRYAVLFSRWQNREDLREFVLWNPDYYVNLYRAIEECPGALRKWLIEHEVDPSFPAGGDAPRTKAHKYMVDAARPEPMRVINEIIADGKHYDITEDIINATALPDAMIGMDTDLPQTNGLNRLLEHNGYVFLGRVRVEGVYGRFWSRNPEKFRDGEEPSQYLIRAYLKAQKQKINDSEL